MNKKKLTIISVVLIMIMAVGGVLAYLTDTSTVTNTFTVGNVDITLDEAKVNEKGEPVKGDTVVENVGDADRVVGVVPGEQETGNKYHLIPGQTYVKDPTMTVVKGSEDSYVRMIVTINCMAQLDAIFDSYEGDVLTEIFNGYEAANWKCVDPAGVRDTAANTITYEFRYKEVVAKSTEDQILDALFDSITVPGAMTKEQLASISDLEIAVTGHAIQAVGFAPDVTEGMTPEQIAAATENNAWAAFDKQAKVETTPAP